MKILIFANNSGGLFDFRGMLIRELLKDHDVVASTPFDDKVPELKELGCRLIETAIERRGMNPFKDFQLYRTYRKILKEEKPDLVITYTIKPNVYGGFACRGKKINYAANVTGLGTAFQKDGMLKKLAICLNRVGLKRAKVVFFENVEDRNIFVNLGIVKIEKTYVLNGAGVDLSRFSFKEYPSEVGTNFLFIGRVMKEKGIDELFAAMKKLVNEGIDCKLEVVGGYEENYKDTIEKYEAEGWLKYWGYQKDVRPFIEKCHCFVLPSWHEGMANTNLECASSGRPVITSDIHGCLEAVEDTVSGYTCESKNSDSLYQAMKHMTELSTEERKVMGVEGRRRMEMLFDKREVVRNTIEQLFLKK